MRAAYVGWPAEGIGASQRAENPDPQRPDPAAVVVTPPLPFLPGTDGDPVTALADLASQMLLADIVIDRLRLAAHAVQAHLDRPVAAAMSVGSGPSDRIVWAGAMEDEKAAILRGVVSLDVGPDGAAVGAVARTSIDGRSLAVVGAGSGWVAVLDPPDDGLGFLRAVGDVVASALATATSAPDEVEMNLMWSAHELRSPLVTVRTAIEQAIRTKREGERRVLLEGGLRELEQLSAVTESLLRFRPEGSERDGRAVDLGRLVSEMLADDGDARRVERACEEGVWAVVDPVQFRIAVMNLVRNAQVHTEHGVVVVRVFREGDRSVVSVEDRGEGVAPELRERIFDPYVQGRAPHGTSRGSGLGLHICKRIIEGHGGNVTIQALDGGTLFAIDVPWSNEGSDTPSAS